MARKRKLDMDRIAAGLGAERPVARKVTGNLFGGIVGVLGFLRCTACGRSTACELVQRRADVAHDEQGWWLVPKDVPGDWQVARGTSEWTCCAEHAVVIERLHEKDIF